MSLVHSAERGTFKSFRSLVFQGFPCYLHVPKQQQDTKDTHRWSASPWVFHWRDILSSQSVQMLDSLGRVWPRRERECLREKKRLSSWKENSSIWMMKRMGQLVFLKSIWSRFPKCILRLNSSLEPLSLKMLLGNQALVLFSTQTSRGVSSIVAQLVVHGPCNTRVMGLIPGTTRT